MKSMLTLPIAVETTHLVRFVAINVLARCSLEFGDLAVGAPRVDA